MPTIARVGPFKIQVFADDHFPPHFHIVGTEFEALIAISDLSILKGARYSRHIAEPLRWAQENIEFLRHEWSRYND